MLTRQDRRLRFEHLERRVLLAGDVQVAVKSGSLAITGDIQGNSLEIWYLGNNRYSIDGTNGTTVSTKTQQRVNSVTVERVTKDIQINLRDGDDEVLLAGSVAVGRFVVPRNLAVKTGAGHDTVLLDYGTVGRDLMIDAGSGNNVVGVCDVMAGRDSSVRTGDDYDAVSMFQMSAKRNLTIRTGGADDEIALATITVGHDTTLDGGQASPLQGSPSHLDRVLVTDATIRHNLNVTTRSGDDDVWIGSMEAVVRDIQSAFDDSFALPDYSPQVTGLPVTVEFNLNISASNGDNKVILGEVSVSRLATVKSGIGIDTVFVDNSKAGQFKVLTGAGNDRDVYFNASQVNTLYIDLGTGDDMLNLSGSTVKKSLKLYGRSGYDWVTADSLCEFPLRPSITGWEKTELP